MNRLAVRKLILGFGCSATLLGAFGACSETTQPTQTQEESSACELLADQPVVALKPQVLAKIPHQTDAYTQGLLMHQGQLFESIGLYGKSALRSIDPESGELLSQADLPAEAFGEGLAVGVNGELVQLTWKEETAYRWSAQSLQDLNSASPIGSFSYSGEGWGLTRMGEADFVMSNGTAEVVLRDPQTFSVTDRHSVLRKGGPADALNELEWDGESIWASRYQSDEILQINPDCWRATAVVDLSDLHEEAAAEAASSGTKIDVANGIANLPGTDTFWVTGKLWPSMYLVKFATA
ncbi:MAG: glutaminyl-peptide cyclotransferase [Microthrixaceae bacterium]